MANALSYFQNNRDGANFISSALRTTAGHLNDQSAKIYQQPSYSGVVLQSDLTPTGAMIDASGGWWDAGDYLKFVETHSYIVALMLVGVRDFPNQMGAGSSNSNFAAEARFGLDWLQKMWDDNSKTLYYQVGIGVCDASNNICFSDHDIWRLPQDDDTYAGSDPLYRYIRNRPVFITGPAASSISPNLAGRLAADFAECYQVYKATAPTYANQCLLSAEHIFDLANASPGTLLTASPHAFYMETEWRDDMELGAAELYFALAGGNLPPGLPHTDPMFYLQASANWAKAYIGVNSKDVLSLNDVSGLAHYELYRAIGQAGNPNGLAVTQAQLLADMGTQLNAAVSQGSTDPFGFGVPWNISDTASFGSGLSVEASEYDFISGTSTYAAQASRWLGNTLGANAWGSSFIVGDGTVFPDCIHHQVANLVGHLDGTQPALNGAVVEGPNADGSLNGLLPGENPCDQSNRFTPFNGNGAVFVDNGQNHTTNEPALDLAISSPLAFAWQASNPADFSLGASPASQTIVVGGNTSYTATVLPINGFIGTLNLSVGGLPLGVTASFNPTGISGGSGSSTLSVSTSSSTPAGTYILTIFATGGSLSHSQAVTLVVNQGSSTATVTSNNNPSVSGKSVTFTATVTPTNTTGTVQFKDGPANLGSPVTLSSGTATFTTTSLSIGAHSIIAVYSGDANFTGSTSSVLNQSVTGSGTTPTATSISNIAILNPTPGQKPGIVHLRQTVSVTITVTTASGTPSGIVGLTDNGLPFANQSLPQSGSTQSLTFGALQVGLGTHNISAMYFGDTTFKSSASAASVINHVPKPR